MSYVGSSQLYTPVRVTGLGLNGSNALAPAGAQSLQGGSFHTATHEEMYRRVHDLEQKLQYIEKREQEGWSAANQQLQHIVENSKNNSAVVANLELKLSKDIQYIEESLARDVQLEAQRRSDAELRLRQVLQDEAAVMRSALEAAERGRSAEIDNLIQGLTSSMSKLVDASETQYRSLQQKIDTVVQQSRDEAAAIERLLEQQRAKREAAEMSLLQVLEETCMQLHKEIVDERQQRMESHKKLERLLLDSSSRQWVRT